MKVFEGSLRTAFLCFFASHIPITLLIDGQAVLAPFYPQILRDFVLWYCDLFGDVLMRGPNYESWFSSVVLFELLFQLPFFFVSVSIIRRYPENHKKTTEQYPKWFQKSCLVYGSHVATTLIPIIGTFVSSSDMTAQQKVITIGVYSPYFIFPLLLLFYAWIDNDASRVSEEYHWNKSMYMGDTEIVNRKYFRIKDMHEE
jgi:uncharacterized membrane protein YhdT